MKKTMLLLLLVVLLFPGCGAQAGEGSAAEWFSDRDLEETYDPDKAVYITLEADRAVCDAKEVLVDEGTVTIIEEGVFVISGTLDDGMIHVLCENKDKVQIVLDNASIRSACSAPIYIQQADKVFITLAEGSKNSLSNGGTFEKIDDNNIDAVIFSKEDLTLNGSGGLTVSSPAGHGIVGKDDLVVTGGKYDIEAASHGISGKDSLAVTGCEMTIRAGKDGLHCENNEDADKGSAYIGGGSFEIVCGGDGLSASGNMDIDGGVFRITSGGGSANAVRSSDDRRGGFMGREYQPEETADTPSAKGIKAEKTFTVTGGSFNIDASDDALHSNGDIAITGGTFGISTGDDGIHANDSLVISGGTVDIAQSYEGLEARDIRIEGGSIALTASDDGLNAGGGNDASGFGGRGGDMFASDGSSITITGGTLTVNTEGDGVDSNGSIAVSGGTTIVHGPVSGGNGPLDYAGTADISGGIFTAIGSGQMAMNFSSAESQGAMLVSTGAQDAGTVITLKNSAGEAIFSVTGEKRFSCVVISCPGIVQGETYTLEAGDTSTEITMDSLIYGGGSGMMGGRGGMGDHGPMGGFGGMGDRGAMGDFGGMGDRGAMGDFGGMGDRGAMGDFGDMGDFGGMSVPGR